MAFDDDELEEEGTDLEDEDFEENEEEEEEEPVSEATTEATSTSTGAKKKSGAKKSAAKKGGKKSAAKKGGAAAPKKAKERKVKTGLGIIGTIFSMISAPDGASKDEIMKTLVKKFPDKEESGMLTTLRIQVNRLGKRYKFEAKKHTDEKRGLVYKAPRSAFQEYLKANNIDLPKAA
jgi:hypothetical protein